MVTNRVVFVKSPGSVVVVRSKAIYHLHLAVVLTVPSGRQSILIYLENAYGPMTSALTLS